MRREEPGKCFCLYGLAREKQILSVVTGMAWYIGPGEYHSMPDDAKATIQKLVEKLKTAGERAKKLKLDAEGADKQMDAVETENK